jgi:hypothetical protein
MTFAEIVIFVVLGVGLCLLLAPLQKRLEARLHRFFRSNRSHRGPSGTVIDVTDSFKKKDNKDG